MGGVARKNLRLDGLLMVWLEPLEYFAIIRPQRAKCSILGRDVPPDGPWSHVRVFGAT